MLRERALALEREALEAGDGAASTGTGASASASASALELELARMLAESRRATSMLQQQLVSLEGSHNYSQAAAMADAGQPRPWLVIGIPTVGRKDGLDYLNPTIDYIVDQLPPSSRASDPYARHVVVLVVNNAHGKPHPAFEQAVSRFRDHPMADAVRFVINPRPLEETGTDPGTANFPGARVRQQSRDAVATIREGAKLNPDHYLLMEDDFRVCPHALRALEYAMSKMYAIDPDWIMLRVSHGLAGGLFRGKDLVPFADYLEKHLARRPPDHLFVEWFVGATRESLAYKGKRTHFGFKYSLLQHFGTVSSLRAAMSERWPGCYDVLREGTLFDVEVYKPSVCGHDDIWPCLPASEAERSMPPIDFGALASVIRRVDHGGGGWWEHLINWF